MTKIALTLIIVLLLPNCAQPLAQETETWTPKFENADLYEFIKFVQEATGKTFVIDPRVRGQVTIFAEKAANRQQLYGLLLATLEVNGYAAVEVDGIVRILPKADVKTQALPQTN
jgi:general secretion pathway protein D